MSNAYPPPPPPVPLQKKGMSTGCIIGLVIGVVGLVGLVVIAILAALAVPTFARIQDKARQTRERALMQSLEMSLRAYRNDYGKLPGASTLTSEGDYLESKGPVLLAILGEDSATNPRGISYADFQSAKEGKGGLQTNAAGETELLDAWGNPYRIYYDLNEDSYVDDPELPGVKIPASVFTYSAGPDGDYSTWKDNVRSVQ